MTLFARVTSITIFIFLGTARAGGVSSGGGDAFAAEFVETGWRIAEILKRRPLAGIDSKKFENTVKSTFVISLPRTFIGKVEVDAIKYPPKKRIEMSRKRWSEHALEPRRRMVLVAHEYFGIMGIDDKS